VKNQIHKLLGDKLLIKKGDSIMGIFTSCEDDIKEEDRRSAFDRIEKQFLTIPDLPEEVNLCALFTGDNGTGKSGVATSYLKFLEEGETMIYIDLDAGDKDNLVQYWQEEVADGKLRYYYPIIWERVIENGKQARINYDKSIEEMRLIAMWLLEKTRMIFLIISSIKLKQLYSMEYLS